LTGIKTHTLRVWEKRYGLLKPQRTCTNIRFYLDHDLQVLRLAVSLYRRGLRISRIAEMSLDEMKAENNRLSGEGVDEGSQLLQYMVAMDFTTVDQMIDEDIRQKGFPQTLSSLILPFLERMEALWLSADVTEAHETCFREIIRRKTLREIDLLPHNCTGPRVVMLLPQGNRKELNHVFLHYLLRNQGICVTDMGAEVRIDCACSVLQSCRAEGVFIANADPLHWQFGAFIRELVSRTTLPIIISGNAAEEDWSGFGNRVIMKESVEDIIELARKLKTKNEK
jgi:DNA-binding transcriptional MerR regulator